MSSQYKNLPPSGIVHLDFIEKVDEGIYRLDGAYVADRVAPANRIIVSTNAGEADVEPNERPQFNDLESISFKAEVKVQDNDIIEFFVEDASGGRKPINVHTGFFTYISPLLFAYRNRKGEILVNRRNSISVHRSSLLYTLICEARFWFRLLFYWRMPNVISALKGAIRSNEKRSAAKIVFELVKPALIAAETIAYIPRAYLLRTLYFILAKKKSRPIWIISDRGMAAGDNGEALYKYIRSQDNIPADVYFVISKKSPDFKRLERLGNVLDQDSLKYRLKFLLADKIISSHADVEVTNPFLRQRYHFQDLMRHEFIFLQHGVIRHDHSSWLNKYEKNIKLFITSAEKEYKSILDFKYFYEPKVVALTGLSRFDYLDNDPQNKIILAPTYRRELARIPTDKNGARSYDNLFKNSKYFETYNKLLTDERLINFLRERGSKIELYLHPNLSAQRVDFKESDVVSVMDFPYDYAKAFKEGSLLITDYSSVSFDFAYLNKPLIYYQFDKDTFFEHSFADPASFFSDEEDGFGPVVIDHETLIDKIVCIVESGYRQPETYSQRVNRFFYKIDKNNSQRVYDAILAMDADV